MCATTRITTSCSSRRAATRASSYTARAASPPRRFTPACPPPPPPLAPLPLTRAPRTDLSRAPTSGCAHPFEYWLFLMYTLLVLSIYSNLRLDEKCSMLRKILENEKFCILYYTRLMYSILWGSGGNQSQITLPQ